MIVSRRRLCDSLSRQLSRHIGQTSTAISSKLKKITNCPSASSIRFSGDSSEITDQKFSGSSAADANNLPPPVAGQLRRHIKVVDRDAVLFQHFPAQAKHQPEHSQLLLYAHSSPLIFNCMVSKIRPIARINSTTGKARIRSIRIAFGVCS